MDFYRTTTTEAPKPATSFKQTYSPKRNYPLQARQRAALTCHSLPQNHCKQCPQLKNQGRTYVFAGTAVTKNQLSSKSGNSAAPCPAVKRNKSSSRLRRNRSALPPRSPGGLIQKRGRARPLYWPSGDRQGGPSEGPLDRLSLHRRRRFLSPRERKGGRAAPLAGTTRKTVQP